MTTFLKGTWPNSDIIYEQHMLCKTTEGITISSSREIYFLSSLCVVILKFMVKILGPTREYMTAKQVQIDYMHVTL